MRKKSLQRRPIYLLLGLLGIAAGTIAAVTGFGIGMSAVAAISIPHVLGTRAFPFIEQAFSYLLAVVAAAFSTFQIVWTLRGG
jgi:hypothetical protein